jgi:hypothetical protein
MTYGDKIRAMSDKELAEFLVHLPCEYFEICDHLGITTMDEQISHCEATKCQDCLLEFLKTEVDE